MDEYLCATTLLCLLDIYAWMCVIFCYNIAECQNLIPIWIYFLFLFFITFCEIVDFAQIISLKV